MKKKTLEKTILQAFSKTKASDWSYHAEGSLHIVLSYKGNDVYLKSRVLRLRKKIDLNTLNNVVESDIWKNTIDFMEKTVVPCIGRAYIRKIIITSLTDSFLDEIACQIEPNRPVFRKIHSIDKRMKEGLIMYNYCVLPPYTTPTICFEIKPKWGFIPFSSFITHEIKKIVDRFSMHQHLKYLEKKIYKISQYLPPDFFSYNTTRVLHSLKALVQTPQNNFRMFVDGLLVYPEDENNVSFLSFEKVLMNHPYIGTNIEDVLKILTEILVTEPLLNRIRTMQMFDDCDIEGIYPYYQKKIDQGEKMNLFVKNIRLYPRTPPTSISNSAEEDEAIDRFMVSCSAKDCSVMITLKPSYDSLTLSDLKTAKALKDLYPINQIKGCIYSLAVVDFDPKPLTKIPYYFNLDRKITETYEALMRNN